MVDMGWDWSDLSAGSPTHPTYVMCASSRVTLVGVPHERRETPRQLFRTICEALLFELWAVFGGKLLFCYPGKLIESEDPQSKNHNLYSFQKISYILQNEGK